MSKLQVHRGRYNSIPVNLGIDISTDTITSEIRERPRKDAPLIATFSVTVTDASNGLLVLVLDDSNDDVLTTDKETGFMDIKRLTGTGELPAFNRPIPVEIVGSVTA